MKLGRPYGEAVRHVIRHVLMAGRGCLSVCPCLILLSSNVKVLINAVATLLNYITRRFVTKPSVHKTLCTSISILKPIEDDYSSIQLVQ